MNEEEFFSNVTVLKNGMFRFPKHGAKVDFFYDGYKTVLEDGLTCFVSERILKKLLHNRAVNEVFSFLVDKTDEGYIITFIDKTIVGD